MSNSEDDSIKEANNCVLPYRRTDNPSFTHILHDAIHVTIYTNVGDLKSLYPGTIFKSWLIASLPPNVRDVVRKRNNEWDKKIQKRFKRAIL